MAALLLSAVLVVPAAALLELLPPVAAIPARARCKNGKPILSELFCNGLDDCGDGSDELDCSFRCLNGAFIPKEWRCDGDKDCPGEKGEDEQCFTCNNGKRIVPQFVCDGDNDCGDRSDENACFKCGNGKSISVTWRCDGTDDCGDSTDEQRCDDPSILTNTLPRARTRRPRPRRPGRARPRTKQREKVVLTPGLRSYILKWHNRHRLELAMGGVPNQPGAANMKLLRWDDDIAEKSQAWAEKCDYTHEKNKHCMTAGFHSLGENIAVSTINFPGTMTTDRDLLAMVKHALESMWGEHAYYTYGKSPGKCSKQPCGHYTQMSWAETEAMGCGMTSCNSIKNWAPGRKRHVLFLVCKYGPAYFPFTLSWAETEAMGCGMTSCNSIKN